MNVSVYQTLQMASPVCQTTGQKGDGYQRANLQTATGSLLGRCKCLHLRGLVVLIDDKWTMQNRQCACHLTYDRSCMITCNAIFLLTGVMKDA